MNTILRCNQCGLLYVDPPPSEEELEKYYTERIDPRYLLKYKDQTIRRGKRILRMVQEFKKGGDLLEIGCGYGFFLNLAKENGWKTYGVELSPDASEYARKTFNLDIFTGDISQADLKEKSFDFITLQHILEHLPQPLKTLNILNNALRDDGILVIVVPNTLSLMARWAKTNWLCLAEKTHLFHYSKNTLKKLLEKSGFQTYIIDTFQWDTQRLLWAIKVLILGQKNLKRNVELGGKENIPCCFEDKIGLFKKIICRMAYPFSWTAGKLGLGAEIIALAKKRL